MPKDRDQMTPAEPEDEQRLEDGRGPGRGGSGQDLLPAERSAPGATSSGGDPAAVDELPADERGNYR